MLVCTGRFAEGIDQLNRYVDAYPRGRNVSRAHLFLAKAHIGLNRTDKAKEIFNTILRDYPDSLEAHKARYKLAFMEYLEGNEAAALKGFESLAAGPDGPLCAEAAFFRDSIRAERYGER
jgi:TolA-binding protein